MRSNILSLRALTSLVPRRVLFPSVLCWCFLLPIRLEAEAPVTAIMNRPVARSGEIKAQIDFSIERGWQVYGHGTVEGAQSIQMALDGAPTYELLGIEWPKETTVVGPDASQQKGYDANFQVQAVVRKLDAKEGEGLGAESQAAEPVSEALDASAAIKPVMRASIKMSWLACRSQALQEGRKNPCIPGEAIFVLKLAALEAKIATARDSAAHAGAATSRPVSRDPYSGP